MRCCENPLVVDDRPAASYTNIISDILSEEKSGNPWPVRLCRVDSSDDLFKRSVSVIASCQGAFDSICEWFEFKSRTFDKYSSVLV